MNLPAQDLTTLLWWFVTAVFVGLGWTLGCWIMGTILGRFGK